MVQLNARQIGPDGLGGAYKNMAEPIQSETWYALGGKQGVIDGMTLAGVAGSMAIDVAVGGALVSRLGASGTVQNMGYMVPNPTTTRVTFGAASASARNDALVCAVVDTSDGAVGTGGLPNGGHLVAVPGVSGTITPRLDSDIRTWLGRGGYVRLADVPIASTDTQINMANVVKVSPYNVMDTGWINLTPTSGTGTLQYRVVRGEVFLQAGMTGITAIAVNTAATMVAAGGIPAAYRPSVTAYGAGSAAGSFMSLTAVNTDGSVSLWNPAYNSSSIGVFRVTMSWRP